jgi:hypothetical protein
LQRGEPVVAEGAELGGELRRRVARPKIVGIERLAGLTQLEELLPAHLHLLGEVIHVNFS